LLTANILVEHAGHWKMIEALSAALVERKQLTGQEVRNVILDAHWRADGGTKENRSPSGAGEWSPDKSLDRDEAF
jgi:hypothetical protein